MSTASKIEWGETRFRRGDYVYAHNTPTILGVVIRSAKDGTWVDVRWPCWSKRQPKPSILRLLVPQREAVTGRQGQG